MAVVIETTIGDITVDLYTQQRPQTCKNFLKLCKIKYYNFCLFHTVQANFIAQTGDPSGNGTGGESVYGLVYGNESKYYEAEKVPKIKHSKAGLLSMVNCGNNMLGSQFFVTLGGDLQSLEEHCVFAEVTEGLDILSKLNETICDHLHRPYQDIRITHTVILEDPFEDLPGLLIPPGSPEITPSRLANGRIGADEKINDEEGLTEAQLAEIKAEREAKARATILEIVGDLPDAEIAPPENVLFVCKLNPVTTDEDLEIIFSRFGKVKSCEVIRDHSSGDSLQYAFVEFDDRRSCEQAYLKMDNVLIDDRRIHVDFSQSVSKIRWRGKGKGVQYLDDDKKDVPRSNDKYGSKRDYYRDRERDRNPRRRDDDRRRRIDEDYRRRDRRKETSNSGSRRRDEDGHDDRYDETRKRRELREERRREEERRYSRQEGRRRDDGRRRIDDKKRNGTERKDKDNKSNKKTELKEKKEQTKVENKVDSKKEKVMEPPPKKEETVELENKVPALPNNIVPEKQSEVDDTPDHASQSPSKVGSSKSTGSDRRREDRIKKRRRRRRHSSSSASTSSDSSESSSSSTSMERRKRSKKRAPKSLTVAKKYYHKGKLVKVIKKRKKKSTSPTESSETSDSDRKRKKSKYRKVIKVIKRRSETSEDSDSSSSDSDLYTRKKKKKKNDKNCRKKKRNKKKKKLLNSSGTSDSEFEDDITERKKSKIVSSVKKDKNDMSE